jgi:hypothetical protein
MIPLGATIGDAASVDGIGANLVGWSTRTGVASAWLATTDAAAGSAIARLETEEIDSRAGAVGRNGRSLRGRVRIGRSFLGCQSIRRSHGN